MLVCCPILFQDIILFYNKLTNRAISDTVTATQSFIGNGGISQLYGGLSVELFNHISLECKRILYVLEAQLIRDY